jgi:hypothetical protein
VAALVVGGLREPGRDLHVVAGGAPPPRALLALRLLLMCSGWCKWVLRMAFVLFAVGFVYYAPEAAADTVRSTWDGVTEVGGEAAESFMTFVSELVEG